MPATTLCLACAHGDHEVPLNGQKCECACHGDGAYVPVGRIEQRETWRELGYGE